jgi:hypothetical protein
LNADSELVAGNPTTVALDSYSGVAGATTIWLTPAQQLLANNSASLWTSEVQQEGNLFGVLRCGTDHLNSDNLEWIQQSLNDKDDEYCYAYNIAVEEEPREGNLVITKELGDVAEGDYAGEFDFTVKGADVEGFSLELGNSNSFDVEADTPIEVTEAAQEGWELQNVYCEVDNGINEEDQGDLRGAEIVDLLVWEEIEGGLSVEVPFDTTVECVFYNVPVDEQVPFSEIAITKELSKGQAPSDSEFEFTVLYDDELITSFELAAGETSFSGTLSGDEQGTHTITEDAKAGWKLDDIVCEVSPNFREDEELEVIIDDAIEPTALVIDGFDGYESVITEITVDGKTTGVNIDPAPGEFIECVFYNGRVEDPIQTTTSTTTTIAQQASTTSTTLATAVAGQSLARTGSNNTSSVAVSGILLLAGTAILGAGAAARRRKDAKKS